MLTPRTLLYFLFTLAFSLSGQALLKTGVGLVLKGVRPGPAEFLTQYLPKLAFSPHVLGGIALSGVGVIGWMYVLSMFDLSRALPILGGLAYIVLFFVGKYILREQTNWLNFAGIVLIVGGLFLVSYKAAA